MPQSYLSILNTTTFVKTGVYIYDIKIYWLVATCISALVATNRNNSII